MELVSQKKPPYWNLVADVGGTNARFGLAPQTGRNFNAIEDIQVLRCADYKNIQSVVNAYLERLPLTKRKEIQEACVAVAGPTEGDRVEVTNLSWVFSKSVVAEQTGLSRFAVINDFSALALACPQLRSEDKILIGDVREDGGVMDSLGRLAVIGPGTGLGVCGVLATGKSYLALPCEGGHATISPVTDEECSLYNFLKSDFPHVSAEHFLSGRGIENIYRGLGALRGIPPTFTQAEEIGAAALNRTCEQARDAVIMFCNLLGTFVGDVVLTLGARNGVYLGGGILPMLKPLLLESDFENRVRSKGVMSSYVANTPIELVVHPFPALIGASFFLSQKY
nr:glucokinase [Microbulbifer salipaludis]